MITRLASWFGIQPVAYVTDDDVRRVVLREFSEDEVPEALTILSQHGRCDLDVDVHRIRAAAVKVANGDIRLLKNVIRTWDYRDILAAAEYPEYRNCRTFRSRRERATVICSDDKQYRDWLEST